MRFTNLFCLLLSLAFVARAQNTNVVLRLITLEEVTRLALEHNLDLQVERFNPIIVGYSLDASVGTYYDPVFNSEVSRRNSARESGGFNTVTGQQFPGNRTEVDTANSVVRGNAPTGMRYELFADVHETTASVPREIAPGVVANSHSADWDADAGIRVTQPLLRDFWIDAGRLAIKLNKKNLEISDLGVALRVMQVITDVEVAYYELIFARENVRVQEAAVAVKQRFVEENTRKVQVGSLAPLDAKQAEAELATSKTQLLLAHDAAGAAENQLKALINDNYASQIGVRLELTDKLLAIPPYLNLNESFKAAMEKRPELQQARLFLQKQDLQLKYDKNQVFPRLDATASWAVNGLDPHLSGAYRDVEERRFQQDFYGLIFQMPLTFKKEQGNKRASEAAKKQAILQLKQLEEIALREVDDQVRIVRTAYEGIGLTRDRTAYAQGFLEAEQRKLEVGRGTSFFVLDAASRLTAAQVDEIAALRNYNQALARLSFREGTTLERRRMELQKP